MSRVLKAMTCYTPRRVLHPPLAVDTFYVESELDKYDTKPKAFLFDSNYEMNRYGYDLPKDTFGLFRCAFYMYVLYGHIVNGESRLTLPIRF